MTRVSSCASTRPCIQSHYTITFLFVCLPVATSCIVKLCFSKSEEFGEEPLIPGGSGFRFLAKVDERLKRPHDLKESRGTRQLKSRRHLWRRLSPAQACLFDLVDLDVCVLPDFLWRIGGFLLAMRNSHISHQISSISPADQFAHV